MVRSGEDATCVRGGDGGNLSPALGGSGGSGSSCTGSTIDVNLGKADVSQVQRQTNEAPAPTTQSGVPSTGQTGQMPGFASPSPYGGFGSAWPFGLPPVSNLFGQQLQNAPQPQSAVNHQPPTLDSFATPYGASPASLGADRVREHQQQQQMLLMHHIQQQQLVNQLLQQQQLQLQMQQQQQQGNQNVSPPYTSQGAQLPGSYYQPQSAFAGAVQAGFPPFSMRGASTHPAGAHFVHSPCGSSASSTTGGGTMGMTQAEMLAVASLSSASGNALLAAVVDRQKTPRARKDGSMLSRRPYEVMIMRKVPVKADAGPGRVKSNKGRKPLPIKNCIHLDRPHRALGLCGACYGRHLRQKRRSRENLIQRHPRGDSSGHSSGTGAVSGGNDSGGNSANSKSVDGSDNSSGDSASRAQGQ